MSEAPINNDDMLLEVEGLTKHFMLKSDVYSKLAGEKAQTLKAVDGIDFHIKKGEVLGLVGESGCGKSTTARLITRLIEPTSGKVSLKGEDLLSFNREKMQDVRKEIQLVFQDPYSSLNPRKTIMQMLSRPLEIHGLAGNWKEKRERVLELLSYVGLGIEHIDRYPHEFSGGQRQRISIARALLKDAPILLLDEATAALDAESERQVQEALTRLQAGRTTIVVAHRLATVREADLIVVMDAGRIVATGTHDSLLAKPGLYARLCQLQFFAYDVTHAAK